MNKAEAVSEAEGRRVSPTATVTATPAAANGLRQPSTTNYSRTMRPELGIRYT